jgi:hypothetical protein
MRRNRREDEGLTEDEIARRKLGPRGVPGGKDSAKNDARTRKEHSEGRRIRRPRCVALMAPHGVDGTIRRSRS